MKHLIISALILIIFVPYFVQATEAENPAYTAALAQCETEYGATAKKQKCDSEPAAKKTECTQGFDKNLADCKTQALKEKETATANAEAIDTLNKNLTAASAICETTKTTALTACDTKSGTEQAVCKTTAYEAATACLTGATKNHDDAVAQLNGNATTGDGDEAESTTTSAASGPMTANPISTPRLNVPFPTLEGGKLSPVDPPVQEGAGIVIPWIGEYFAAAYQYMVGVAVILGIILIMVGGLQWSASAGSAEKVGAAKKRITSAIMGVTLALGSYLILYTVNPALVEFKALVVPGINPIPTSQFDDSLDEDGSQAFANDVDAAQGSSEPTAPGVANATVKAMASFKALYPAEKCGDPATVKKIINDALENPLCQGPCNCAPTVIKIMAVSGCPISKSWGMVPKFFKEIETLQVGGKQIYKIKKVSVDGEPGPGDIIFTTSHTHVGMYYGGGKMVDSGTSAANWSHCHKVAPNCSDKPGQTFGNETCSACALIKATSPIGNNGRVSYVRLSNHDVKLKNMEEWKQYCSATVPKPKICESCATNQCFAQRKFDSGLKKWQFDEYAHYIGG